MGIVARCLRASGKLDWQESLRSPLTPRDLEAARRLVYLAFMDPSRKLLETGDLKTLGAWKEGGMVFMRGRFSPTSMQKIVGSDKLPVVPGNSRLALLLAWEAHLEDHNKDPVIVLARLRRKAWVVRARNPVKTVTRGCMYCRRTTSLTAEQLMGELPPFTLEQADPFKVCSVDLFGPLLTRGLGGHARKTFKTWGVLYACLASKAIAIWGAAVYDTDNFLLCHQKQVAIYGKPALVISDQGTQLKRAAADIDWAQVAHKTAPQGTAWRFTPPACPWRNGNSERAIGLAKKTLHHLLGDQALLNFAEMETLFLRVAQIVNYRPLSARVSQDGHWVPIAPNDLLHGRASGLEERFQFLQDQEVGVPEIPRRLQQIAETEKAFWSRWSQDGFPLFCPRPKWHTAHRNLCVGDIVLVKYEKGFGKEKYRLGKVKETQVDRQGLVRTVVVQVRDKRKGIREGLRSCKAGLVDMNLAVQRLVVLLPVEETWEAGLPGQTEVGDTA